MKSTLSENDIENFWIRCYLNLENGVINAAIKRAYLDFCRTVRGLPKEEKDKNELYDKFRKTLYSRIHALLDIQIKEQEEFDQWHQGSCTSLMMDLGTTKWTILTAGQAQKWVNMSLKYLYALGEEKVKGISKNYMFFHVPIDNIIQQKLLDVYGIPKLPNAWSQIKTYNDYFEYQLQIRDKLEGKIPMDVEFQFFNESFPL